MFYTLKLNDLVLSVRLGWPDEERETPQEVRVSVEFRFKAQPKATRSDQLSDTICYAKTAAAIRAHCDGREFKLIERLGFEIYDIVRAAASDPSFVDIGVKIHKVHPPVEKLEGGSWFECGDFQS